MSYRLNKILLKLFRYNSINRSFFKNGFLDFNRIFSLNFPEGSLMKLCLIGANDGVSFDTLHERMQGVKVSGVAVEPIIEYYELLSLNFKKFNDVTCLNFAIHEEKQKLELFKVKNESLKSYPPWAQGINSFSYNHLIKLKIKPEDVESVKVSAFNMNYLVQRYFAKSERIYLQIDVEGYDDELIKAINFECFRPLILKYEHVNIEVSEKKIIENKLRTNDYYILHQINDSIALDLRNIRLI